MSSFLVIKPLIAIHSILFKHDLNWFKNSINVSMRSFDNHLSSSSLSFTYGGNFQIGLRFCLEEVRRSALNSMHVVFN